MKRKIELVDTTLRDGEQAAGIAFSASEKKEIATALSKAGIRWIEAGTPAMGTEEQAAMRRILGAGLEACAFSWNRACREDIQASLDCGFSYVHISVPVSDLHIQQKLQKDRDWVIEQLKNSVAFAQAAGCRVSVGAEDSSRAREEEFLELAFVAAELGAERIRYADTVGWLNPFQVYDLFARLVPQCPLPIEFHPHNDFGLACANALAALRAGVNLVSGTVNGIGERAGNAALEEVIAAAHAIYRWESGVDLVGFQNLCRMVAKAAGRPIFPYKAVIGEKNRLLGFPAMSRAGGKEGLLDIQPLLDKMLTDLSESS